MKYYLLIILLLIPINTNANDLAIFKHPSGVFEIAIPKAWGKGTPFKPDPSVFTFYPSENSEFTVSITPKLNLPSELPLKVVKFMFPEEKPISEPKREKGDGWNSIRQDFESTKNNKTRVWLGKFYGYKSRAISITLSDSKENINGHKEVFERIVSSIVFK